MLRAFGHPLAMHCDMLSVDSSNLSILNLEQIRPNMSQQLTGWPHARSMFRPTILRYFALKWCDRLTRASARSHNAGGIENGDFTLKTHQRFSVHTTLEEFKKRNNHWSPWICVWGKLRQGNHIITIATSSFLKSPVFKMFSVHAWTKSRRFQTLPVWWAFSKSFVFVTDLCGRQT